ncbi:MAG: DUF502 domain-containing protein [Alphaproteobacteria bacterium]|nr:DUF502 domain-containing protein [Alphaproteobacteria bacterium]
MSESNKKEPKQRNFLARIRTYFLTGLVVTAPILITGYLVWLFVQLVDGWARPFIPRRFRPETYLPFDWSFEIPGTGVVAVGLILILVGAIVVGTGGAFMVKWGDRLIGKIPAAGTVYRALRQIFQTAVSEDGASFSKVALIEYPRKGVYAVCFVTKDADTHLNSITGEDLVGVFLPTTPNPTSGFLLFVPRNEMKILDMSVEQGARLVISAGLADESNLS